MANIFLLLIVCIASSAALPTKPDRIQERRCGQVITESSGTIAYKVNSTADGSERCAFTLSVPGASKYILTIEEGEFSLFDGGLYAFGIQRSEHGFTDLGRALYKDYPTELEANTVVLLFHTLSSSTTVTGFLLSFVVETEAEPLFSLNEIAYTSLTEGYNFSRGLDTGSYRHNEMTTLLHVAGVGAEHIGIYYSNFEENCEEDFIFVFGFTGGFYSQWTSRDRLCSNSGETVNLNWGYDAVLYVFRSNEARSSGGFYLELSSTEISKQIV